MFFRFLTPFALALTMTGCFVSTVEDAKHDTYDDSWEDDPYDSSYVSWINADAKHCKSGFAYYSRFKSAANTSSTYAKNCYEFESTQWRNNCGAETCNKVDVFTHYMLPQDLGNNLTVYIEAFDNPYFHGYPKGSVQVTGFEARQGQWERTELFLEDGEYYLRAYLTNTDDQILPYRFGKLDLVANEPVGTFGALSSPQRIVLYEDHSDPINIFLDQIFRTENDEIDTDAFLRVSLETAEDNTVPDQRDIVIELRNSASLEANPTHRFVMPSSELLVQGRVGKADFLSPELPEGEYYLFVFIDANSNGFYDKSELAAMELYQDEPKALSITADHTVTSNLVLQEDLLPADSE